MREKSYEELSFTDDFMFCKIMMNNPDLCKQLLEIILQKKIRKIVYQNTQESMKETWEGKGIRLDVYLEDEDNTVYDIEMQATLVKELPKRSRYYQGMIDLNLIEKGARYKELKESYIIFICTFDPFGANLPVYTFENRCLQNLNLRLDDKTAKVFLNPKGDLTKVPPELAEFLKYLADNIPTGEFTRVLQEKVDAAIIHKEWRLEYMTLLQKFNEKFDEGFEEGREKGYEAGQQQGLEDGRAKGLAEGLEQGLAEGRAEGRAEGHMEGLVEGRAEGHTEGLAEGVLALYSLVEDKLLPLEEAAKRVSMNEEEFLATVEKCKKVKKNKS